MANRFNYSYKKLGGVKFYGTLPYSPSELGFKYDRKSNCCLHFRKEGWLLRIKLDTNIIILEPVDDDGAIKRNVLIEHKIAENQEHFNEILEEWL